MYVNLGLPQISPACFPCDTICIFGRRSPAFSSRLVRFSAAPRVTRGRGKRCPFCLPAPPSSVHLQRLPASCPRLWGLPRLRVLRGATRPFALKGARHPLRSPASALRPGGTSRGQLVAPAAARRSPWRSHLPPSVPPILPCGPHMARSRGARETEMCHPSAFSLKCGKCAQASGSIFPS